MDIKIRIRQKKKFAFKDAQNFLWLLKPATILENKTKNEKKCLSKPRQIGECDNKKGGANVLGSRHRKEERDCTGNKGHPIITLTS